jgi:hypothetical protein
MKTSEMYIEHVHAIPIETDWEAIAKLSYDSEMPYFYEAIRCDKCNKIVILNSSFNRGDQHKYIDQHTKCNGNVSLAEGPMMNYWYPCKIGDNEIAAKRIINLPLCVVEVNGFSGLALTGGGMDLSWEICEAYMRLGYLPPAHFARELPAICDRGTSKKDRWIIQGCRRSLKCEINFAKNGLSHLKNLGNNG